MVVVTVKRHYVPLKVSDATLCHESMLVFTIHGHNSHSLFVVLGSGDNLVHGFRFDISMLLKL